MDEVKFNFPDITLLVTVYNRSQSLKRLLDTFAILNITFGEIVVSDDASQEPHLSAMKEMQKVYNFKLISALKNGGLGHNLNKGQHAVSKPFTLYVQEDFVPKAAFAENLINAYEIMTTDLSVDTVRFYGYFSYPYTKPYGKGFDEMIFEPSIWKWDHLKFYVYSDHPHLRRSNFLEKFGVYKEGIKSDETEFHMCLSFIKNKGKGLLSPYIHDLFDQLNSADEPSTINRSSWRESKKLFFLSLRKIYLIFRYLKNNYQLSLKKKS